MGINAKNIVKSCVKNYPFALCFLLISFLVYIFLPDYLDFLIYSSPVIVFSTVVYRVLISTRGKSVKTAKGEEDRNNGEPRFVENENEKGLVNSSHIQTTRRRNVKEENKEGYTKVRAEEKSTVYSSRFNDDLVDKSALEEEIPKEIREVKVDSVNDNVAESSTSYASQSLRYELHDGTSEGGEMERGSSEDTDDEDEEGQRERNKAVEWTEDDEKNVMDLGLSEIERNRRLESLIARRRSRRLLSLQARKTQVKVGNESATPIASILVPRSNPFLANTSGSQISPTPGSAPSVLLPMRNPFDLPYDPQEERPNLTGDSFHQEFMAAHQKDMMFCRHESFSMGPFERPDNNRSRNPLGRIHTKQVVFEDFNGGSSPSSSSNGKTFKAKRESILKSPKLAAWKRMAAERRDNGRMNEFLFDSGPSVFGRITMRERRYHSDNEPQHTPTNSLASDMQVEVSESSSPPLTVDGDEESSLNDRDMEKKITSAVEETWGASPHLSEVDKNESSSREIHEVSELDIMQVGFSRINHKSGPISSQLSPVKEVEPEPFDSYTFPHSKIELTEKLVARPSDNGDSENGEIQDRAGEQGNGEVESAVLPELAPGQISTASSSPVSPTSVLQNKGTTDQASSSTLDQEVNVGSHQASGMVKSNSSGELPSEKITLAAPHNTPVLAQDSTDQLPNERDSEIVQESSNTPEKFNMEMNSTYSENDSEIPTNNDIQNLKSTKNLDGEDNILIKQENEGDQSKPSEENNLKSTDHIAGQFDKPDKENDNSKPFKDNEGESENLPKHEEMAENSTPVEENEIRESSENRVEEQSIEEAESSANSQSPNESIEQVSITASSVSSPKSVLNPKFNHTSLSVGLDQDYVEEQQSHTNAVENNLSNEMLPENLAPVAPLDELRWTADLTAHSSNDTDLKELQEPINPSNAVENNLSEEMLPENVAPVPPQSELCWMADSTAHPSNDTDLKELQDPINPSIMSHEEAYNVDESFKHEEKGEEKLKSIEGDSNMLTSLEASAEKLKSIEGDSNILTSLEASAEKLKSIEGFSNILTSLEASAEKLKSIEGDSNILTSLEATAELLKPYKEPDSKPIKETEAMLDKLSEDIASAARSKPAEQSENSVTPLAKEEEPPSNPPNSSVEEVDISSNANVSSLVDNTDPKDPHPPQSSVEEADISSNKNESSVIDNTDSKDPQSTEESGDRNRGQAHWTQQWWLTID